MLWSMAFASSPLSLEEHSSDWRAAAPDGVRLLTDEHHQKRSYRHAFPTLSKQKFDVSKGGKARLPWDFFISANNLMRSC